MSPSPCTGLVLFAYALSLPLFAVITALTLCPVKVALWRLPLSVSFRSFFIFTLISTPLESIAQANNAWELWNKAVLFQISESVGQSDASSLFLSVFEKVNVLCGKHNLLWFLCSRQCDGYLRAVELCCIVGMGEEAFQASALLGHVNRSVARRGVVVPAVMGRVWW